MHKIFFCLSCFLIFSCTPDTKEAAKSSTIDLGVFTGQNYDSQLLKLTIPKNWKYELKSISIARQVQLSKEQVKENVLPISEVKEVTLFEAKEDNSHPEIFKKSPIPGSIVCLAVNLKKQDVPNMDKYIEKFRAEMMTRNKKTEIAKFHLAPTRTQKFNNIEFKSIDSQIKYPTIEGAENIVIHSKMLFQQKGDLVYRYSLSYATQEQLKDILKIVSSIVYK